MKFCPFWDKTALKLVGSCWIDFTYAKMTQTQTSRMNFTTVQKVGFIKLARA